MDLDKTSFIGWTVRKGFFRNTNHAVWFVMSFWLLIINVGYFLHINPKIIILLPICIHLTSMIQAITLVYIRKGNSEVLSKDCIWFNALLVIFYCTLFFFVF